MITSVGLNTPKPTFGQAIPLVANRSFTPEQFNRLKQQLKQLDTHIRDVYVSASHPTVQTNQGNQEVYIVKGDRLLMPIIDDDTLALRYRVKTAQSAEPFLPLHLRPKSPEHEDSQSKNLLHRLNRWTREIVYGTDPAPWQTHYLVEGLTRMQRFRNTLNQIEKRIRPFVGDLGVEIKWPIRSLPSEWGGFMINQTVFDYPLGHNETLLSFLKESATSFPSSATALVPNDAAAQAPTSAKPPAHRVPPFAPPTR